MGQIYTYLYECLATPHNATVSDCSCRLWTSLVLLMPIRRCEGLAINIPWLLCCGLLHIGSIIDIAWIQDINFTCRGSTCYCPGTEGGLWVKTEEFHRSSNEQYCARGLQCVNDHMCLRPCNDFRCGPACCRMYRSSLVRQCVSRLIFSAPNNACVNNQCVTIWSAPGLAGFNAVEFAVTVNRFSWRQGSTHTHTS